MALNEIERRVINNLVKQLSPDTSKAAPEIAEKLADEYVQTFLQTWVVEPLKILADPNRTRADLKDADSMAA